MTRLWPGGQPITVEAGAGGEPLAFAWQGRIHAVERLALRWRVDLEWWRAEPVWREYFKLVTDGGLLVIVYHDLRGGSWYLQRVYD